MKSGKLILVTELYGAGKTTLTQAAIARFDNLEYLKTTTTRPARAEEVEHCSPEYDFVGAKEYAVRRSDSKHWDHMSMQGYSYGADVDAVNTKVANGTSIICCIAPHEETIAQMSVLYAAKPMIIWIVTSIETAGSRHPAMLAGQPALPIVSSPKLTRQELNRSHRSYSSRQPTER